MGIQKTIIFTFSVLVVFAITNCTKDSSGKIDNPYDNVIMNNGNGNKDSVYSPSSIQGLHKNLFKPTCANSGCHDGTFEPDFRTVQSAYNTLINIKPIKQDTGKIYFSRVIPGNADASMLIYRMTVDLGGNSGIMPLVLDPGSDYPAKKDQLLTDLKKWINDGAKDFNGKTSAAVDFPPQITGLTGLVGVTPLARGGKYEAMYANAGTNVQLWFALADDKLNQNALTNVRINWSTDPENYDVANEKPLTSGTKTMPGLYNSNTVYGWYYNFNTAGLKSKDVIWFKIICSDGSNINYSIPNDFSMFFLKKYVAIKIL
jgi:hypothetical protein